MKQALTLSIVIPVYNEEDYIGSCLQAIAQQSVKPDEVIVVDNNSTDNTATIAAYFPFVKLITESKQGLFHARNTGMKIAKGDIIGRIDADTIVNEHWVSEVKQAFKEPAISSASGPVGYHDWAAPKLTLWAEDRFLRIAKAARYDFLMGANMAIRQSAWGKIASELCNETHLFEDIDIAVHLKAHGLVPAYIPAMSAWVSGRRFDDNPLQFIRYIGGHTRTLEHHHQDTPAGVHFAEAVFGTIYFIGGKPLYKAYDPEERRFSLRKLFVPSQARPDPMNVIKD